MQKAAPRVPGVDFYAPTVARGLIDLVPTANAKADGLSWWHLRAFGTRLGPKYEPVSQKKQLVGARNAMLLRIKLPKIRILFRILGF
jgi:hypothetical protein